MSSHVLDQEMSIASIVPSKDNARHIDTKSASFTELKESIKAGGVQIPIHVWPHPDKRKNQLGIFEIRCGERRWLASKMLGAKTIPAIVHRGINYQVAMLLTITENKFHEKLTPLEEVEEISRCMDNLDGDAKLIAGLIGQTEQWVRLRANIHRNLGKGWRKEFTDLGWSIGHLTLIARLPAAAQAELLKNIQVRIWQWNNVSVQDLDHRLSDSLMLLNKAKWNLDDERLLPKAGACSDCKKRSGAEPVLWFGPLENQIDRKDRCLDPLCWNKKMNLYLIQRAKYFRNKFSNLAFRSTEHLSANEKEELTNKFGRVYDPEDVQKSTSGSKDAIPALVVAGKGAGSITFVREKRFASPGGGGPKRKGKVTPLKERREQLKGRRWAQVLLLLCEKIDAAPLDDLNCKDRTMGVMALAAIFGNQEMGCSIKEGRKIFEDLVGLKGHKKALELLWDSVKPTLINMISYGGPVTQIGGVYVKTARWIAELINVDIDKMFTDVSKSKGFTVPKSWAALNEDGSQKKKKAKAAKEAKPAKAAKKTKAKIVSGPMSRAIKKAGKAAKKEGSFEAAKAGNKSMADQISIDEKKAPKVGGTAPKKPKVVKKSDNTVKVDFSPGKNRKG